MGKMTFVVEFEDGKEPPVSAAMDIAGGRLVAAAWSDYRDDFFTDEQQLKLGVIMDDSLDSGWVTHKEALAIMQKAQLLTF